MIRVLESFRAPRPTTNPYVVQLARSLAALPDVEVRTFDWRTALVGGYDVVHVHWPEILVSGAGGAARAVLARVRFALWLARLRVTRTPVVRTVHNERPHEDLPRSARALLRGLDALVVAEVHLNAATRPGTVPHVVVPHGHYRDWYATDGLPEPVPGRAVSAGIVRDYKQVPELVTLFRSSAPADATLHVVGAVPDPALAARVRTAADGDPRVTLELTHVDDARFVRAVGEASVVALPYAHLLNSGGALAALSLGRPVLVPDTPTTAELDAEVGPGWVRRYTPPLRAEVLTAALAAPVPDGVPDLTAREWAGAAAAHRDLFARVTRRRSARRRRLRP